MYQLIKKILVTIKSCNTVEFRTNFRNERSSKKKNFLFVLFIFINVTYSFAQDVITLKNGNEITALVYEIGDIDVKYKKIDNPNGPNYTLKKSEILMIRYANGSKDVFADTTMPANPPTQTNVTRPISNTNERMPDNLPLSAYAGIPLKSLNKNLYTFDGTDKTISGKGNYVNFLKENCSEAYDYYKKHHNWELTGIIIGGTGFIVAGMSGLLCALSSDDYDTQGSFGQLSLFGGIVGIGGYIISITNHNYIKNSLQIYNQKCTNRRKSDLSLNFGVTRSGGIGFTLDF